MSQSRALQRQFTILQVTSVYITHWQVKQIKKWATAVVSSKPKIA